VYDLLDAAAAAAQGGGAAVTVTRITDRDTADRPGTPKASWKAVSRAGGMPKKHAPRPSSTAVSSMSSDAIPVSTSQ
jgi:hypothetical protein